MTAYTLAMWRIRPMREDPRTPATMGRLIELCEEARPGVFEVVLTLP
jgi:hypothetical protein